MKRLLGSEGQMTVGLAVALPVVLAVALVSYNALAFFSECARFDRLARNAVRICAVSPAYEQGVSERAAAVETLVADAMSAEGISVSVAVAAAPGGERYDVVLEYEPTLFGLGLRGNLFGVDLFVLRHEASLTVDSYDPGVLL